MQSSSRRSFYVYNFSSDYGPIKSCGPLTSKKKKMSKKNVYVEKNFDFSRLSGVRPAPSFATRDPKFLWPSAYLKHLKFSIKLTLQHRLTESYKVANRAKNANFSKKNLIFRDFPAFGQRQVSRLTTPSFCGRLHT